MAAKLAWLSGWRKPRERLARMCDRLHPTGRADWSHPPHHSEIARVKRVLVIDIGGSNVKLFATGHPGRVKIPSGPGLTPRQLVQGVKAATAGWAYDVVTIGYPGPIVRGRISREPVNLGAGWIGFNFSRALGTPVRLINDAAMQALGSYRGRSMLFLGLGTGLGTTLIRNGVVVPLEVAHLPYREGKSFEQFIGDAGLLALGKKRWRRHVAIVVDMMLEAFVADYAVLGGGNVRLLEELPPRSRRGNNANAFRGGERMWLDEITCT
jgi:hypothetical protein